ncbi:MAG: hypothetical protein ABIV28_04965 [Longimicrobiales bacterium]
MEIIALKFADRRLLSARYEQHGNSHRIMRESLLQRGAGDAVERLEALRNIERSFDLDLGLVCHLYERRGDADRHPIEKMVVEFITDVHVNAAAGADGDELLWIRPDRVRQVRDLMQGQVVSERE